MDMVKSSNKARASPGRTAKGLETGEDVSELLDQTRSEKERSIQGKKIK